MLIVCECLLKQIIHLGKQEMYSLIVFNVIKWLYGNLHNAVMVSSYCGLEPFLCTTLSRSSRRINKNKYVR